MENKQYKVVGKALSRTTPTKEMVDWLIAHGKAENDKIAYHDPLLVQCVEELHPSGFYVTNLVDSRYKVIDLPNDSIIFTPNDLEALQKSWVEIPEELAVPADVAEEPKPETETPVKKPTKKSTTKKATTGEKKSTTRKKKTE